MTALILIIGISFLIFIHELGHFLVAKFFGLYVEEFGFGFPPRLFGKKIGETVYSINALPFGGFVKIFGEQSDLPETDGVSAHSVPAHRNFSKRSIAVRSTIIVAGVVMNFLVGWLLVSLLFFRGVSGPVIVESVQENSPAATAGFRVNDQLVDFRSAKTFIDFVNSNRGVSANFSIARGTTTLSIIAEPSLNPPAGRGALGVGVTETGFPKLGFFASLKEGFVTAVKTIWFIFEALVGLISGLFIGHVATESFVGPVGIFQIATNAARFGILHVVQLIAIISLNLAVLNVMPFPALDGGRLFFLLIEKMKGSPLSAKKELIVNALGFWILILLMVFITARDVIRLF